MRCKNTFNILIFDVKTLNINKPYSVCSQKEYVYSNIDIAIAN